ncbi:putative ybl66, partial [Escherichia coli 88.0221]
PAAVAHRAAPELPYLPE